MDGSSLGTGEIFWSSLKTCEVDIYWCEIKFRSLFYLHIWISLLGYHTIDLRNLVIFDPFSSMFGKLKKSSTSSIFFRELLLLLVLLQQLQAELTVQFDIAASTLSCSIQSNTSQCQPTPANNNTPRPLSSHKSEMPN